MSSLSAAGLTLTLDGRGFHGWSSSVAVGRLGVSIEYPRRCRGLREGGPPGLGVGGVRWCRWAGCRGCVSRDSGVAVGRLGVSIEYPRRCRGLREGGPPGLGVGGVRRCQWAGNRGWPRVGIGCRGRPIVLTAGAVCDLAAATAFSLLHSCGKHFESSDKTAFASEVAARAVRDAATA